jgi:predicted RNA-binding protein with PUA-like domain
MAGPASWLIKSEPSVYPWSQLVAEGRTAWTGVRNFEARNHLRAMKLGDLALYYHSNEGKEIVALAKVVRVAYPDPTAPGEDWTAVDVAPERALSRPVTLAEIKADAKLSKMLLVTRSRISVVPVTQAELDDVLRRSETAAPPPPPKKVAARGASANAPLAKPATPKQAPTKKSPAKKAPAKKSPAKKSLAKKRAAR